MLLPKTGVFWGFLYPFSTGKSGVYTNRVKLLKIHIRTWTQNLWKAHHTVFYYLFFFNKRKQSSCGYEAEQNQGEDGKGNCLPDIKLLSLYYPQDVAQDQIHLILSACISFAKACFSKPFAITAIQLHIKYTLLAKNQKGSRDCFSKSITVTWSWRPPSQMAGWQGYLAWLALMNVLSAANVLTAGL